MIVADVKPQEFAGTFRKVPEQGVASVEDQIGIEQFRVLESSNAAADQSDDDDQNESAERVPLVRQSVHC